MKNKKILIAIVALVAVVALFLGVYFATRPDTQEGTKTFTVSVVHSDGKAKDFTFTSGEEYLGTVLQSEGLVAGEMGEFGLYINTVDGEKAVYDEDGAYWAFYEGEDYAMQSADQTPITDGAVYKLVYTIG